MIAAGGEGVSVFVIFFFLSQSCFLLVSSQLTLFSLDKTHMYELTFEICMG